MQKAPTPQRGAADRAGKASAQNGGLTRRNQEAKGPARMRDPSELVKFAGLVALLAIFADAAVGHALLWENDPYWTYWITKTLLIATVFGLGTAWIGIGPWRGAVVTAVHTIILTVYYWSLSPIGLPIAVGVALARRSGS